MNRLPSEFGQDPLRSRKGEKELVILQRRLLKNTEQFSE